MCVGIGQQLHRVLFRATKFAKTLCKNNGFKGVPSISCELSSGDPDNHSVKEVNVIILILPQAEKGGSGLPQATEQVHGRGEIATGEVSVQSSDSYPLSCCSSEAAQ